MLRVISVCNNRWSHRCIGIHCQLWIGLQWSGFWMSVLPFWLHCIGACVTVLFCKHFLLVWCVGGNHQGPCCLRCIFWGECLWLWVGPFVFCMLCSFHLMICFSLVPLKLHLSWSHIISWDTCFLDLIWLGRHQFDLCTWCFPCCTPVHRCFVPFAFVVVFVFIFVVVVVVGLCWS